MPSSRSSLKNFFEGWRVGLTSENRARAGYPQAVDKLRYYKNTPEFYNDLVTTRRVDLTDITDITVWSTSQKLFFSDVRFALVWVGILRVHCQTLVL